MSVLESRKSFLATLLAFAVVMMLSACSSTGDSSSSGVPCDIDPGQPHCVDELKK